MHAMQLTRCFRRPRAGMAYVRGLIMRNGALICGSSGIWALVMTCYCYCYCYMVQDIPEHPFGSQCGSWGTWYFGCNPLAKGNTKLTVGLLLAEKPKCWFCIAFCLAQPPEPTPVCVDFVVAFLIRFRQISPPPPSKGTVLPQGPAKGKIKLSAGLSLQRNPTVSFVLPFAWPWPVAYSQFVWTLLWSL
jgi:hypothetical protein